MVGEYLIFYRGLEAMAALGGLPGAALTLYMLESLMVLIMIIALVSFVASGLFIYYRARGTRLLMASPLSAGGLYTLRTVETFALTSWALGIVGLPALLALGMVYAHVADFYIVGAVILLLFAALTASVGALVTIVAGAALRRARTRLSALIVVTVMVAGFAALVGKNVVPSTSDFFAIFEPATLNGKPSSIKFIERKFTLWPSHPFAAALYASATGGRAGSPATQAVLWLAPAAALVLAATVGRAIYVRTLPTITEGWFLPMGRGRARAARRFRRRLRGPIGALIERDLLVMRRSPHEWGRAAFLGLLLLLYTSFIFVAPLRAVADQPETVVRLVWLNILASGYFLTAFGLRFVFPSTSLEGRAAWLLFSSPVALRRLSLAKLGLYAGLLSVGVLPIALAGTFLLVHDLWLLAALGALVIMIAGTTCAVLLAAGTAWPNFREPHADALSTSASGLLATLVCLVYVAAMGWFAREMTASAAGGAWPWLGAAVALSGGLVAAAFIVADRNMPALEAP